MYKHSRRAPVRFSYTVIFNYYILASFFKLGNICNVGILRTVFFNHLFLEKDGLERFNEEASPVA